MSAPVLTIDGPSGAGKGTVSRAVANRLGWHYLDSGSIYRSLAIATLQAGVELEDVTGIIRIAEQMRLAFECREELTVRLNDEDITGRLALESTGNSASIIAAYPEVRSVLLAKQREFARPPGLVADGRDMGTVVFPEADFKVFLTASAEERANRRYKQLIEKGIDANLPQITREVEERDKRDMQRKAAPLVPATDALYLDSTDLSIDEVIAKVLSCIE